MAKRICYYFLLVGVSEIHSQQSVVRHEELQDSCSILPNNVERNECFEKCYRSIESIHNDEMEKNSRESPDKDFKNL